MPARRATAAREQDERPIPEGTLWRSTVGRKVLMAVSGAVMIAFVLFHLGVNLLVFRGAAALDEVAAFLDGLGPLLWAARAALIVAAGVHIWAAARLWAADSAARPTRYVKQVPQVSTVASRTIRWTGGLLLAFLVFHVLHFATGTIHPVSVLPGQVYANVVGSLRIGWVGALYIAAMIVLGLHLHHGGWSFPRSLGLAPPKAAPMRRPVAALVAVVVWLGFTAIPLAALTGALR